MSLKNEKVGVVVSDKMDKGVVVAVERKVRSHLYGKIQRRTSRFMAHDEENTAKVGDEVLKRKRWVMTRVVRKAVAV
jgi:small subunit ribosomal protein S17